MLLETAWKVRLLIRECEDKDKLETEEMVIGLGKRATLVEIKPRPQTCAGDGKLHGQGDDLWRLASFGNPYRVLGIRYLGR